MIDISLSDKQLKPGVIHTDQFENGVHVLRFIIPDYMQNTVDLRKFNAYVVTSLNGVMDVTQIPYTISNRQVILTWSLSSHTLMNPGIIQYQIKFAGSADATGAVEAVWISYKGVIVNRLSINAEDYISANYPTLLKQQMDLIHTLSGAFGAEIVYMPVGEPIPVEERLAGRLYYQWLDTPTTVASCATGTVNLGERPLADSGLYINGAHVFVDNTSEEAYVLGASAWIEAVAAANCGVTASDISDGKDTILLISAKNAGEAGNNIGLQLGLALYGAGANTTNPSGGHVSGSTLAGGSDIQTGVEHARGRLEDSNGNVLHYGFALEDFDLSKGTVQQQLDGNSMVPDYSSMIAVSSVPYTAPSNGYFLTRASGSAACNVVINGYDISNGNQAGAPSSVMIPVAKGDIITAMSGNLGANFIPAK